MWICESEFNYWIFLLRTSSFNHAKKQALKPQMPQLILGVLGKFFELVYCRRLNNRFSYLLLEFSFSKLVKEGHLKNAIRCYGFFKPVICGGILPLFSCYVTIQYPYQGLEKSISAWGAKDWKKKSLAISMEICSQLPLNLPKINWVWLVLFGGVAWSDVFKRVGRFIAVQLEKCLDQPLYLRSGWVHTCTGYLPSFYYTF